MLVYHNSSDDTGAVLQGQPLTADNRGLGSAILFHETSHIGPEPMLFGDGGAITHPGATDARVSLFQQEGSEQLEK